MKTYAYFRAPTGRSRALSPPAQRAAIDDACARHGWSLDGTFGDGPPEVATRGGWRALLRCLLDDDAPAARLLIATVDTLGDDALTGWRRWLQARAAGAEVLSADGARLEERLLERGAAGVDLGRGARTAEAMRRRALRGEVLGRAPYGYLAERTAASRRRSRLVREPAEAAVVARIFNWYLRDGEGVRRIAARLNAEGARTRAGKPWSLATVRNLLRNPVYTGTYERLGVRIAGAHEAIVPVADFRAVQRRLDARRTPRAVPTRARHAFSGLARCGRCGARLVAERRGDGSGGARVRYRCGAARNQARCPTPSVAEEEIAWHVRRALAVPASAPDAPLFEDTEARHAGATAERRLDRMIARRISGQWTDDQLLRRAGPVALAAAAREWRAGAPLPDDASRRAARDHLAAEWDALEAAERADLIVLAVREVVVFDDEIRVTTW